MAFGSATTTGAALTVLGVKLLMWDSFEDRVGRASI
jgi:hypothetical protein